MIHINRISLMLIISLSLTVFVLLSVSLINVALFVVLLIILNSKFSLTLKCGVNLAN